jgi:hypothetical protein
VLFDFDGPICSVFDGYPTPQITSELLALARRIRVDLEPVLEPAASPHGLLLAVAGDPELAGQLEADCPDVWRIWRVATLWTRP